MPPCRLLYESVLYLFASASIFVPSMYAVFIASQQLANMAFFLLNTDPVICHRWQRMPSCYSSISLSLSIKLGTSW